MSLCSRAWESKLLSPWMQLLELPCLKPCFSTKEVTTMRSPCTTKKTLLIATRESLPTAPKIHTTQNKWIIFFKNLSPLKTSLSNLQLLYHQKSHLKFPEKEIYIPFHTNYGHKSQFHKVHKKIGSANLYLPFIKKYIFLVSRELESGK